MRDFDGTDEKENLKRKFVSAMFMLNGQSTPIAKHVLSIYVFTVQYSSTSDFTLKLMVH